MSKITDQAYSDLYDLIQRLEAKDPEDDSICSELRDLLNRIMAAAARLLKAKVHLRHPKAYYSYDSLVQAIKDVLDQYC